MRMVKNSIITPDGTVLVSRHRHDYVSHTDANGYDYFIDGGLEYVHCSVNEEEPAKSISVFLEDGHEKVRDAVEWGTYGINGDQPLKYVKLRDMETDHIQACLDKCSMHPNYKQAFEDELEWRTQFPKHVS